MTQDSLVVIASRRRGNLGEAGGSKKNVHLLPRKRIPKEVLFSAAALLKWLNMVT